MYAPYIGFWILGFPPPGGGGKNSQFKGWYIKAVQLSQFLCAPRYSNFIIYGFKKPVTAFHPVWIVLQITTTAIKTNYKPILR